MFNKKGKKYPVLIIPAVLLMIFSCALSPESGNIGSSSGGGKSSLDIPPSYAKYFVATNGSDANPGTKELPFLSIQKAVVTAPNNAAICVGAGSFFRGAGLQDDLTNGLSVSNRNNILLLGGWNDDFSGQTGMSTLDGTNSVIHIVSVKDSSRITIDGFIIKNNLNTNYTQGGGIYMLNSSECTLSNCLIMSNGVSWLGGGIYIGGGSRHRIYCEIAGNKAGTWGGGMYVYANSNTINCFMHNNQASAIGGGLNLQGNYNTVRGIYISNEAPSNGGSISVGGYYLGITWEEGHYNDIDCVILNSRSGYGGGIFVHGNHNIITGSICGNDAGYGGGLYLSGNYNTVSGLFCSNDAGNGGGLCVDYGTHNKINAYVCSNTGGFSGGAGLFLYCDSGPSYSVIEGSFIDNSGATFGGGIFLWANACVINATVAGNSASYGGGIRMIGDHNTVFGKIVSNTAYMGGGLYANGYYCLMDCSIIGNSSVYYGGGIEACIARCEIKGLIIANSSSNGGGIYLEPDPFNYGFNTISAAVISNTAFNGGGIYSTADFNTVTNSLIIGNSSSNGAIYLTEQRGGNSLISCTVGGDGSGYAVYEGTEDNGWSIIRDNIFLTNTLDFLYHDFADGDIGTAEIGVLNSPFEFRHDAAIADGNSVQ